MNELIEALQIFKKYYNPEYPFHCEHDVLYVCGIDPDLVSEEDKKRLDEIGFFVSDDTDGFASFKYGSC